MNFMGVLVRKWYVADLRRRRHQDGLHVQPHGRAADADREENWQQAGGIEDGVSFELSLIHIYTEKDMNEFIVGAAAKLDTPRKPREEAASTDCKYFCGITGTFRR